MARVGVTLGGAAIGAAIGSIVPGVGTLLGAQIGAAIGGGLSAVLFNKAKDQEGPQLNESGISSSAYGNPIPIVAGRAAVAGQLIWADRLEKQTHRRRQGKGGGPRITEYTYSRSVAVGICEWLTAPIDAQILRIWLDEKLVYDASGASEVTQVPGLQWRFYPGSATQDPDALLEAKLGVGEAPAFRDLCYAVFENLPLDPFGRRLPNFRFEVSSETEAAFPQVATIAPASPIYPSAPSANTYHSAWCCNVAVDHARGRIYEGRSRTTGATGIGNDELIRVYDLATMATVGEFPLGDMVAHLYPAGETPSQSSLGAGILHLGMDGYLYVTGGAVPKAPLWKIDPDAWRGVGVFGPPSGGGYGFGDAGGWLAYPMQIRTVAVPRGGAPRVLVIVQGSYSATLTIDAESMSYLWGAVDVTTAPAVVPIGLGIGPVSFPVLLIPGAASASSGADLWVIRSGEATLPYRLEISRVSYAASAANAGAGIAAGITTQAYDPIDIAATIDAGASYAIIQGGFWDETDGSLVLVAACGGGPLAGWSRYHAFKWSPSAGIVWVALDLPLPAAHDARGEQGRVLSGLWGLGGNFLLETATGRVIVQEAGASWGNLGWLDERQGSIGYIAAGAGSHEVAKRYLLRQAAQSLTVGAVVEALAVRAGLEASDIDRSALSDTIRGFIVARPMSARAAIEPLAGAFLFDAVEADDVLAFVKRGGPAAVGIPYEHLVREGDEGRLVLEEGRSDPLALPRDVTIRYPDFDRDYEAGAQSSRGALAPTATTASRGVAVIDLAVPLTATEAATLAVRVRLSAWRERSLVRLSLGPRYARLAPADVVHVTTRDGAELRLRILSIEEGANYVRRIEAVTEDAATYTATAPGATGDGYARPTIPLPYATRLILPDLALVADGDDLAGAGLREYAFAGPYDAARWQGVRVYRSAGVAAWDELGAMLEGAAWGAVLEDPPAPASPWVWDESGEILVRMAAGAPESATAAEVLEDWANLGALVSPGDGSAELVQWRTATAEGEGVYRLSGLLRGRRGTEDLIASRGAGDLFVILEAGRLAFSAGPTEASVPRAFRALSVFDTLDTVPATTTKATRGRAEKPYAPVYIESVRVGSDIAVSWMRRARIGAGWAAGLPLPLGEASEAYELDILAGAPARLAPRYDAESDLGVGYGVANAFDGETASFPWASAFGASSAWVRIRYAEPVALGGYAIQARNDGFLGQSPAAWVAEAWDPVAAAWVAVDSRSGQTGWTAAQWRAFAFTTPPPAGCSEYRIRMTANNGDVVFAVEQFAFFIGGSAGPNVARVNEAAIRTIASATPAATYTAAQQTSDYGAAIGGAFARLYQLSATVGRGVAAEITLG